MSPSSLPLPSPERSQAARTAALFGAMATLPSQTMFDWLLSDQSMMDQVASQPTQNKLDLLQACIQSPPMSRVDLRSLDLLGIGARLPLPGQPWQEGLADLPPEVLLPALLIWLGADPYRRRPTSAEEPNRSALIIAVESGRTDIVSHMLRASPVRDWHSALLYSDWVKLLRPSARKLLPSQGEAMLSLLLEFGAPAASVVRKDNRGLLLHATNAEQVSKLLAAGCAMPVEELTMHWRRRQHQESLPESMFGALNGASQGQPEPARDLVLAAWASSDAFQELSDRLGLDEESAAQMSWRGLIMGISEDWTPFRAMCLHSIQSGYTAINSRFDNHECDERDQAWKDTSQLICFAYDGVLVEQGSYSRIARGLSPARQGAALELLSQFPQGTLGNKIETAIRDTFGSLLTRQAPRQTLPSQLLPLLRKLPCPWMLDKHAARDCLHVLIGSDHPAPPDPTDHLELALILYPKAKESIESSSFHEKIQSLIMEWVQDCGVPPVSPDHVRALPPVLRAVVEHSQIEHATSTVSTPQLPGMRL